VACLLAGSPNGACCLKSIPAAMLDRWAVFAELDDTKPENVSYIVLRLADDSFVHVSFHNHSDDEVNPISSTAAFAHFQEDHGDRRKGDVDQKTANLVGAYLTAID
jgi:hypothetical protein